MENKRNPWLAGLLSLLSIGLGQVYCGKLKRSIILVLILILSINSIFYLFFVNSIKPFNIIIPISWFLGLYLFLIVDAFVLAKKSNNFELQNYNRWYYYILYSAVVTTFLLYTDFVSEKYEAFYIPSQAMENTLLVGDYFMADNTAYLDASPKRSDLVLFIYPGDNVTKYIKRCIGVPGDTLEIIDRIIYINGSIFKEPETIKFLNARIRPRSEGGQDSPDNYGPIVIPENSYFMMGDNRDNSSDSRFWGTVPKELLIGKARTIHWSKDWNRIGMILK